METYKGQVTSDTSNLAMRVNYLVGLVNRLLEKMNTKDMGGKKMIDEDELKKIDKEAK